MSLPAGIYYPEGYLAADLISPVVAKFFVFRTSNLPPSKERGEGDCGRTDKMAPGKQLVSSLKCQPFIRPSLVPAGPVKEI